MSILNEARRAQTIAVCQDLVTARSLAGDERLVIERAAAWMRQLGYQEVTVDTWGNLTGILRGAESGPTVIFDSHVDTVAAEEDSAWRFPPFSATLAEDRLWGRGTTDMKGPLAAAMTGAAYAAQDGRLRGTVIMSASVGEEVIEGLAFSQVIARYQDHIDLVVICEPSALDLNIAGRGRAEVTVTTHGKSAHASTPHLGVNALKAMARLIGALDRITPPHDPELGDGILEPTEAITTPYPCVSVLPWRTRARFDRRLLVGETEADALDPIRAVIARLAADDPTFSAEASIDTDTFVCYTGKTLEGLKFQPAWRFSAETPLVAKAGAALRTTGQVGRLGHYSFCTNGSYTAARAGLLTVGYGPGFESTAHITNEFLALDQLFAAVEGYYALSGLAG